MADDRAERAHDFDFWVGDWDLYTAEGKLLGRNTITPMFGTGMEGMVQEHWRGNGGFEGRSMNAYDAARGCWHQTWMDASGGVLMLDGGLRDGAMVMEGLAPSGDDLTVLDLQRITWTRETDGPRQLWESSSDEGQTWKVAFDGWYRPHAD